MAKKKNIWHPSHHFHVHFKSVLVFAGAVIFSALLYMFDHGSFLYRTSIVSFPEHAAYDGTAYPIQKVPNYVNLAADKWDVPYSQLSESDLMAIPYYNPSQLAISTDDLTWGNTEHNKIRNAKITYSVPYMGSYELNGLEYDGSHLAVDIKIPMDTPVYAMANGTVIKTSTQSSGFGHHVVIQHKNFPSLTDANAKETIYSSYSHLDNLLVTEGEVVTKGQQIAYSGNTGTATTPHLHFQIDNKNAPWHPYWPFTWQEMSDAGLSFFEAINEKLGYDKAIETTYNPVVYVQNYLDASATYSEADSSTVPTATTETATESYIPETETTTETPTETVPETTETVTEAEPVVEPVAEPVVEPKDSPVLNFVFEVANDYEISDAPQIKISLRDQYGEVFSDGFIDSITISSENGFVRAKKVFLTIMDFDTNRDARVILKMLDPGMDRLKIDYQGQSFYSEYFTVVEEESAPASFTDIGRNHPYYEAITYLAEKNVVSGYEDSTFRPNQTVTRTEVLKMVLKGVGTELNTGKLKFKDVSQDAWYSKYLYTAYKKAIVNGDPDGKFRPADTVNKAEFYKILFNAMKIKVNKDVKITGFTDVSSTDWFAPYAAKAKDLGIIDSDAQTFDGATGMSRGMVADAMYKVMNLE